MAKTIEQGDTIGDQTSIASTVSKSAASSASATDQGVSLQDVIRLLEQFVPEELKNYVIIKSIDSGDSESDTFTIQCLEVDGENAVNEAQYFCDAMPLLKKYKLATTGAKEQGYATFEINKANLTKFYKELQVELVRVEDINSDMKEAFIQKAKIFINSQLKIVLRGPEAFLDEARKLKFARTFKEVQDLWGACEKRAQAKLVADELNEFLYEELMHFVVFKSSDRSAGYIVIEDVSKGKLPFFYDGIAKAMSEVLVPFSKLFDAGERMTEVVWDAVVVGHKIDSNLFHVHFTEEEYVDYQNKIERIREKARSFVKEALKEEISRLEKEGSGGYKHYTDTLVLALKKQIKKTGFTLLEAEDLYYQIQEGMSRIKGAKAMVEAAPSGISEQAGLNEFIKRTIVMLASLPKKRNAVSVFAAKHYGEVQKLAEELRALQIEQSGSQRAEKELLSPAEAADKVAKSLQDFYLHLIVGQSKRSVSQFESFLAKEGFDVNALSSGKNLLKNINNQKVLIHLAPTKAEIFLLKDFIGNVKHMLASLPAHRHAIKFLSAKHQSKVRELEQAMNRALKALNDLPVSFPEKQFFVIAQYVSKALLNFYEGLQQENSNRYLDRVTIFLTKEGISLDNLGDANCLLNELQKKEATVFSVHGRA